MQTQALNRSQESEGREDIMLKNVWEIENNPVFCFNKEELHLHRRNLN